MGEVYVGRGMSALSVDDDMILVVFGGSKGGVDWNIFEGGGCGGGCIFVSTSSACSSYGC